MFSGFWNNQVCCITSHAFRLTLMLLLTLLLLLGTFLEKHEQLSTNEMLNLKVLQVNAVQLGSCNDESNNGAW